MSQNPNATTGGVIDRHAHVNVLGDTRNYRHSEAGNTGTVVTVDTRDNTVLVDFGSTGAAWVGLEDLEVAQ